MTVLLGIFGVIASALTGVYLYVALSASGESAGRSLGSLFTAALSAAFAVLWFWLAHRLALRQQKARRLGGAPAEP